MKIKHILFAIIFICFVFPNISNYMKQIKTLDSCESLFDDKEFEKAQTCYLKLYEKYKKNIYRYNYGICLYNLGKHEEAAKEFEYVVQNEKEDTNVISKAKEHLEEINKQRIEKSELMRHDIGDYYTLIKSEGIWQNKENITVYIDKNEEHYSILKRAFSVWDESLLNFLSFSYVDSPDDANIVVYMVDSFSSAASSEDTIGLTSSSGIVRHHPDNTEERFFTKSNIEILRTNPLTNKKTKDDEVYSVCLHEIGHAIGITGHSDQKSDVMYPNTSSYASIDMRLSNRDINTVRRVYGNI